MAEKDRRRQFLEQVNRAYGILREDLQTWGEELAERAEWDQTLEDGLPSNESWTADGQLDSAGREGC